MDIVKDIESDSLNSLLIKANKKIYYTQKSDTNFKVLMELLNGDYVEKVTDRICSNLKFVFNSLETNGYDEDCVNMARSVITFYIRNWMQ